MSFTIRCNKCQREVEITGKNVRDFVNVYAWGNNDFQVYDEMPNRGLRDVRHVK